MWRFRQFIIEIWLPILLIAVWWHVSEANNSLYFPSLATIYKAFRENWIFDKIPVHLVPSLIDLAIGLIVGVTCGIAAGLAIGSNALLRRATFPTIEFLRAVPAVALVPLFIIIIGIGSSVAITVVAITSFWPVLLNTIDGVRGIDETVHDVAKSFRMRRVDIFRYIVLPAASPQIMVGIRLALPLGIGLLIFSEMIASTKGVGYFVFSSQQSFAIPEMWSGMLLLGIVGYVLTIAFRIVEYRILWWNIERNRAK